MKKDKEKIKTQNITKHILTTDNKWQNDCFFSIVKLKTWNSKTTLFHKIGNRKQLFSYFVFVLFGCDLPSTLLKQRFEKFITTLWHYIYIFIHQNMIERTEQKVQQKSTHTKRKKKNNNETMHLSSHLCHHYFALQWTVVTLYCMQTIY